jgi:hypothetical protein
MITIKLYGGLGNQMFQYAAGKALAQRLRSNLYLHTSWFDEIKGNDDVTQRVYELDGFGIIPKKLTFNDWVGSRLRPTIIFKEQSLDYQTEFEKLSGNILLDGYWQSYKYFRDYRSEILEDFKFPQLMSPKNKKLMKNIHKTESVSIHVRRGDYTTKRGRNYHGILPASYYERALAQLGKNTHDLG